MSEASHPRRQLVREHWQCITGIWQTVWLERVVATCPDKIRWTAHFEGFEIGCETHGA